MNGWSLLGCGPVTHKWLLVRRLRSKRDSEDAVYEISHSLDGCADGDL
jgi:hypothetical protein